MCRRRFTLRALLIVMLVAAAFLGGSRFERERQRREDEAKERLALEAERASLIRETMALQARLSQSGARLQKVLQKHRERLRVAEPQWPRVTPDVVWEDVPSTLEAR